MTSDPAVDENFATPANLDFGSTLETLKAWDGGTLAPGIYYGLSDLDEVQLLRHAAVWRKLSAALRASLLRNLTEAGESNFDLDYRAPGMLALEDDAAEVRRTAIDLLWEDVSRSLMRRLVTIAREDLAFSVRAAAASALGRFVLAGELGKLAQDELDSLHRVLIDSWQDSNEDDAVRRRALESISNSSHAIVPDAIIEAWHADDPGLRASAVYAMGRSCDERWEETVLGALQEEDAALLYEAVKACGELEIEASVPRLAELALDDDREISETAILALGEIGGKQVQQRLEDLAEEAQAGEDESLQEVIEDALGSASLGNLDLEFGQAE